MENPTAIARSRFILGAAAGFLAVLFAIWGLDHWVVRPAFEQLEQIQAREDAFRARAAIQRELQQLSNELGDWAEWDDAYAFAADRDPAFIQSNLGNWRVLEKSSHLNSCVIVSRDRQVLYSESYDSDQGETVRLQALAGERPPILALLEPVLEQGDTLQGLLSTERGLLLLAARPILTSQGTGPARGALVVKSHMTCVSIFT